MFDAREVCHLAIHYDLSVIDELISLVSACERFLRGGTLVLMHIVLY
jgi:hypothetical protein